MALTAGIDVGTGAVKVAIMRVDEKGEKLLANYIERIRRRDVMEVVNESFEAGLREAGVRRDQLDYIATTGDGDMIPWRTGHFYGMTTHSRGALFLDPASRAAVDIGALHTRAMRFDPTGRVQQYQMTSQCASGSGQFLENIARYLGISIEEIGTLSKQAADPEKCSSICAVLAETDVINMVSRGISTPNILRGIHNSMAVRVVGLLRAIKVDGALMMTGGLARDAGLVAAIEDKLKDGGTAVTVKQHPLSVFAGAIGAAIWGAFRHGKLAQVQEQEQESAGGG
ncbi:MAG: benzoyl-CoA reductase subunit D [Planctomycetes bacterium]|nr:benzoyl-CoA reductase subunit D [Planctomycetota bacterium]